MSTFFIEYSVPVDKRAGVFAAFGPMTEEDDKKDRGAGVKQIGRWHTGVGAGFCIVEGTYTDVASWAYNWSTMCDIKITPVLDDAGARGIIQAKAAK